MLIGIPFVAYCYTRICAARKFRFMKRNVRKFERDTDVEMYVLTLLDLVEHKGKVLDQSLMDRCHGNEYLFRGSPKILLEEDR